MDTVEVIILTLAKRAEDKPWIATIETPSGLVVETSIGPGGRTSSGPLLLDLITTMNQKAVYFPFHYDMRNTAEIELRKLTVRFLNNKPVFADVGVETARYIENHFAPSNIVSIEEPVSFGTDASYFIQKQQQNARTMTAQASTTVQQEFSENEHQYWVFLDKNSIEVEDGDTIYGNIAGFAWPNGRTVPEIIGKQNMSTGSKVSVRFLGTDTFETFKPNMDKPASRNYTKSTYYGVPKQVLDEAADEAKAYTTGIIKAGGIVAVSLQYDTRSGLAVSDYYGRLLGVVYSAPYETVEDGILAAETDSFKGVNINKELLKPMYSNYINVQESNPGSAMVPLAEFTGNRSTKENYSNPWDGIKIADWALELQLSPPPEKEIINEYQTGKDKADLQMDEKIEAAVNAAVSNYKNKGNVREDLSLHGYINNDLSFVAPYDDRLLNGEIYKPRADGSEELSWDWEQKVRIGDVMLTVPPLSIRVDKQYENKKVTTMRAKSSMQSQVGTVRNVLSMDLYFHDLESINGTKVYSHTTNEGEEIYYYMDGLRALLAQFKKAPFLPIDNEYINESLQIHNVTLRSIQTSTIPGFPEALKATLIVEEFDSAPYLTGQQYLGDKINYPLLRWYYQRSLHQPFIYEPWRTYLPEIERLDNSFTFSIVNKAQLELRQEAVHKFRNMQAPHEFEADLNNEETEEGRMNRDAAAAKTVIDQYQAFMKEWESKKLFEEYKKKYDKKYEVPIVSDEGFGWDIGNQALFYGWDPNSTKLGQKLARKLYGESNTDDRLSKEVTFYSTGIVGKLFNTPDDAFFGLNHIASGIGPVKGIIPKELRKEVEDNNYPGFFQIYLESSEHQSLFAEYKNTQWKADKDQDSKYHQLFLLPAGGETLTKLKQLLKRKENVDDEVKDYTYSYNALAAQINQTEENMRMDTIHVEDMIPISLSVEMENNFSTGQVQSAQTPTMQYFGSSDPQIQISFEVTDSGVAQIEQMMRQIGHYVKNYRDALVSGFMGINNPLVNLFGIRTVLPQHVQYSTVSGHPDRTLVTMTLSAFDKTQRRQEALYGYTGGNIDETLRDRAYDNYDPAIDALYVHERMRQMELYPDLELPKVSELNSVLPKIDANMDIWENRTDQVFLDPDFYISTKDTYRQFLKDVLDDREGINFRWEDAAGYQAESNLKEGNPLKMTAEDQERFEKEASETEYIDPTLMWEGYSDEAIEQKEEEGKTAVTIEKPSVSASIAEPRNISQSAVKTYLDSGEYLTLPTFAEWKAWQPGNPSSTDYLKWQKTLGQGIDGADIWEHLANTVMSVFDKYGLEYAPGEKQNLLNMSPTATTGANTKPMVSYYTKKEDLGHLSWSSPEEYLSFVYKKANNGINFLTRKKYFEGMQDLKNGWIPEGADDKKLLPSIKDVRSMPFQRVMSYFKAIIRTESGWRQFNENGTPYVFDHNNQGLPMKAGLMGAQLTKAQSKNEAKRLIWDWKYNIEFVVKQLEKTYAKAANSSFKEIYVRRLDWMVVAQSGMDLPAIISSNKKADDKSGSFYGQDIIPEASAYYQAVMRNRHNDVMYVTDDIAPAIYSGPNGTPIKEIFNLYHLLSEQIMDKEQMDAAYSKEVQQLYNNVENWTTEEKVKGMFIDMYQHDQTGRMLRAFPSFSLQIIDEGKWYNNFRTWDNFYGYNALHSIDVYKSRKIAADTAVIQMSNMYSGLSAKRRDMEYEDMNLPSFFSSVFWEQYVGNEVSDDILKERKEVFKSMMLETGARIHLRMGYGADARYLPITFNGVITEVNSADVVEIVAQGDGLELTNVISGSEKDTNKEMGKIIEPSDYIGKLLTSKGNWFKDFINDASDGEWFKESPLGIAHFGNALQSGDGTWNPFSGEYGESVQNIYSQNGQMAKEQWMKPDGSKVGYIQGLLGGMFDGGGFFLNPANLTSPNDEDNIAVKLYGSTPWDVIQTFALSSMDYTAAVFPFEMRSSLFFGKPHWPVTYKYDTKFTYDKGTKKWRRELTKEHKKTFMQAHVYSSDYNILQNGIKASEEGVYNNVIVTYDGRTAGPFQADSDIQLDRQRTAMVEANIMDRSGSDKLGLELFGKNYYTAEAQASKYGMSTVRDYMKDMYKGNLTVIGDPTVKPHDVVYLSDSVTDMQGVHMVKAVHHSMSMETGFITVVEPDAYVVNFDAELLFIPDKIFAVGKTVALRGALSAANAANAYFFGGSVMKKTFEGLSSIVGKLGSKASPYVSAVLKNGYGTMYKKMGEMLGDEEMVRLAKIFKSKGGGANSQLIQEQLLEQIRNRKETLKTANKSFKKAKKAKLHKNSDTFKKAVSDLDFDTKKAVDAVFDYSDDADDLMDQYRSAKLLKKGLSAVDTVETVAKPLGKIIRVSGKIGATVVKSALFWTILVDVALEVATSGLVEMWARKKQNAECVKVVPLTYKGKSYLAAMNGHRGGVWGDEASLGDKIMNAEFGQDVPEVDGEWWIIIPKFMNML